MLDLRFVEIDGDRKEIQLIQRFPATIGKSRAERVPPPYHTFTLLPNRLISGIHCSVSYDIPGNIWAVTDGSGDIRSTNGLYGQIGTGGLELGDSFLLQKPGDRVYLLNTTDGRQAYLEVYNASGEPTTPFATQGLEPSLIEFKEQVELKIAEGAERGRVRDARIDEMEAGLATVCRVLGSLDENSGKMIRGALVSAIVSLLSVPAFLLFIAVWNNGEVAKAILESLSRSQQHQEQKK